MTLVDSSVWIDYFRGTVTPETDKLDAILGQEPVAIGDLILAEVLQGCDRDSDFNAVRSRLGSLVRIEIGGFDLALQAARNYRFLRAKGITVRKTIDTLIATRCIVNQIPLLYSDRDFDPFVQHLALRSAMSESSAF